MRHKALIFSITTITLIFSGINALTRKPIWEGQFEIVVASNQAPSSQVSQLLQTNPGLSKLIGTKGTNNKLATQVKILESPSVLKPVFEYVKDQKKLGGLDVEGWRYRDWLDESVKVDLYKRSSVVVLSYKDTDRDLVLPVIQNISKAYQEYSGRDRKRSINQGIQYLDRQIEIYSKKSVRSLRAAQEYGIEQNLTALQGDGANDTDIKNSLNIEVIRIGASNQIRIDEQLKQLNFRKAPKL